MNDSEVKARLAQAEVHFSHYRWDDAIALFEAVLAARPDHPAATQGWATAVEQKNIDEELGQALAKARAGLAAHRFDEALAVLNHAQTRGALSHILKYHSEIDGLRSEAQEGQEWQRRIEVAGREAEALAGRRRFDQALEVLDNTLRPLNTRGWERLGEGLASLRDRLWAERDVSERVQFAQAAYERQDYRLATELAANLHEELPERDDVKRLHERARGAWGRIQDRLAAVNDALGQDRTEDALALLASLRGEHPHNPDWQAIALRVHMDQGRADVAKGRAALVEHEFEAAAEAFEAGRLAFTSTVEIFEQHPTAPAEQAEAEALRDAALSASQAVRDRTAFRWQASRQGWQASREHLDCAVGVRGRDFGEVVAVVDAMLGEARAALGDLEHARLMLADGRQALDARDAGRARESFRGGLGRIEGGRWGDAPDAIELREQLAAGLREAERIQRDVKKLLSQAEAARTGSQVGDRLSLLRRAYERWETAPGLAARLADELLATASASHEAADDDAALALCEQVREIAGAPAGSLEQAEAMVTGIRARREDEAARAIERALAPAREALARAEALYALAADGDLDGMDWDAAERALGEARKRLRPSPELPAPLPGEWHEIKARADVLARRHQVLRGVAEKVAAGRGVETIPTLQAEVASHAGSNADPVVLAVLSRLLQETADDASHVGRGWLVQVAGALGRGELATADAYLGLARSYTAAAPELIPEIKRMERQIASLAQVRSATIEAHEHAARGEMEAALAGYRRALELASDGESGLPADARAALARVLDVEDELAPRGEAGEQGERLAQEDVLRALLDGAQAEGVVAEFVAPALRRWWKLASRAAALARIEAHMVLGQDRLAVEAAAALVERYPRDRAAIELYRSATGRSHERALGRIRRRLERAQRLAARGAYAEALAEIDAASQPAASDLAPACETGDQDEVEKLATEAEDARAELLVMQSLAEPLTALVERMREAGLAGEFDEALATRSRAEFIDLRRRAPGVWDELDVITALILERKEAAQERQPVSVPPPVPPAPPDRHPVAARTPVRNAPEAPVQPTLEDSVRPADEAPDRQPVAAPTPVRPAPEVPAIDEAIEPPPPFDLDDWLSNVTELSPEDGEPPDES